MFIVFGSISQPLFIKVQVKLSALNTVLQENLAGIKVVKAFATETREDARFDKSAEDLMRQQISVQRIFAFLFPVVFLIANLGQAAVMYFGGTPDHLRHVHGWRMAEVQPLLDPGLLSHWASSASSSRR